MFFLASLQKKAATGPITVLSEKTLFLGQKVSIDPHHISHAVGYYSTILKHKILFAHLHLSVRACILCLFVCVCACV